MPLPFIIAAPIVYGAAAGSTSTATTLGVGAGGAAVGAAAYWAWGFFSKEDTPPTQAQQDSLLAQHRMTEERINGAHQAVELLAQEAEALKQEVRLAASSTTVSIDQIHQLSERISETNQRLISAVERAREAGSMLSDSLLVLRETSERSHLKGAAALTMLDELNQHLMLKIDMLIQITANIRSLQTVIDAQSKDIIELGKEVQTLKEENEAKDKIIDITTKELVETKALLVSRNEKCRFFKEKLLEQYPSAIRTATPTGTIPQSSAISKLA